MQGFWSRVQGVEVRLSTWHTVELPLSVVEPWGFNSKVSTGATETINPKSVGRQGIHFMIDFFNLEDSQLRAYLKSRRATGLTFSVPGVFRPAHQECGVLVW